MASTLQTDSSTVTPRKLSHMDFSPLPLNRNILLDNLVDIVGSMSNLSNTKLINVVVYDDGQYDVDKNSSFLKHTISFLKTLKGLIFLYYRYESTYKKQKQSLHLGLPDHTI